MLLPQASETPHETRGSTRVVPSEPRPGAPLTAAAGPPNTSMRQTEGTRSGLPPKPALAAVAARFEGRGPAATSRAPADPASSWPGAASSTIPAWAVVIDSGPPRSAVRSRRHSASGLMLEAPHDLSAIGQERARDFDRDAAPQPALLGLEHCSHAPAAEQPQQAVPSAQGARPTRSCTLFPPQTRVSRAGSREGRDRWGRGRTAAGR
jgi:hypothetical protein